MLQPVAVRSVGGRTAGAATLGLARGFWGHAVPALRSELPAKGTLYLHDLHEAARVQYAREGEWPPGECPAPISRASFGVIASLGKLAPPRRDATGRQQGLGHQRGVADRDSATSSPIWTIGGMG